MFSPLQVSHGISSSLKESNYDKELLLFVKRSLMIQAKAVPAEHMWSWQSHNASSIAAAAPWRRPCTRSWKTHASQTVGREPHAQGQNSTSSEEENKSTRIPEFLVTLFASGNYQYGPWPVCMNRMLHHTAHEPSTLMHTAWQTNAGKW